MNREIKFRGKRIDDGEWIYGFFASHPERKAIIVIVDEDEGYFRYYDVVPETVGQYIGLKDENGTKIYEGDIVEFDDVGEEGYEYKEGFDFINRALVIFEQGRFALDEFIDFNSGVVEELSNHEELTWAFENSKIIGNIHENKELLEGNNGTK